MCLPEAGVREAQKFRINRGLVLMLSSVSYVMPTCPDHKCVASFLQLHEVEFEFTRSAGVFSNRIFQVFFVAI